MNNLRYTRNLVAFIECLEKSVYNAIDGTATALPSAQKVSLSILTNLIVLLLLEESKETINILLMCDFFLLHINLLNCKNALRIWGYLLFHQSMYVMIFW